MTEPVKSARPEIFAACLSVANGGSCFPGDVLTGVFLSGSYPPGRPFLLGRVDFSRFYPKRHASVSSSGLLVAFSFLFSEYLLSPEKSSVFVPNDSPLPFFSLELFFSYLDI